MAEAAQSFDLIGSIDLPASPVVLSVPHAGRDYPLALRAALRVPLTMLVALEDRHVDRVVLGARSNETLLIQRPARAWIDLNRAETERDPHIDEGALPGAQAQQSAKLRSGLGLIPRRIGRGGDLWRRRLTDDEVMARIAADHRPYHVALAQALEAARRRFGTAILLDVHSMPPLGPAASAPAIVFGDRFGRTAGSRFVHRLEGVAEAAGLRHALNSPYAGGHILDRHGCPAINVHAIQIEWDRACYLDAMLDAPGPGTGRIAAVLRRMIAALADEAVAAPTMLAAE